jgi:hypothetical protein
VVAGPGRMPEVLYQVAIGSSAQIGGISPPRIRTR